ncbi:MAG: hypothetical protein IIB41_01015 [Candidatus Marinimicrobia bacterium]|nr:hypothetical protein [Candidatus Neomarinimicrobiota bacterium]
MKKGRSKKVNTTGKKLTPEMRAKVVKFVEENLPLLILIAEEQAERKGILIQFKNGKPTGWLEDLIAVGVYGICRGALAWQQKIIEQRPVSNFESELRQAARVRVKHLAGRINKFPDLLEDTSFRDGLDIPDTSDHDEIV